MSMIVNCMRNSYEDDSDDSLPTYLFEWATTHRGVDGSTVARDVINHDVADRRKALHAAARGTGTQLNHRLSKLGEDISTLLEQAEFDCSFTVNTHSRSITLTYDDVDDINNDRRNSHTLKIVSEVAARHGARVTLYESAGRGHMGTMTVGFPGIGFGAQPRVNHDFDPYHSARHPTGGHRIADLVERLGIVEDDDNESSEKDTDEGREQLHDGDEMT